MASIQILVLLTVFSYVTSYEMGDAVFENYLFQYWANGEDSVSWCNAEQACHIKAVYGSLAAPKTQALNNFMFDFLEYWRSPIAWLGGNDIHTEGYWSWTDGTQLNKGYTNWISGEPNNEKNEDCLEINQAPRQWNDKNCGEIRGYVCQADLTKTTKANFVVLAFSDSFSEGSKTVTSIKQARAECQNKGLNLLRDVQSDTVDKLIQTQMLKFKNSKYCIDDGNLGKMIGIDGVLNQECVSKPFQYVCEGYRPHYIKLSDKEPVVEESGNLEIECIADGYPVPDVVWHKNYDHVITTDTNESIHQEKSPGKSTLVIKNAKQGDEDRYRCFATNTIDGEERSLRIYADLKVMKNVD